MNVESGKSMKIVTKNQEEQRKKAWKEIKQEKR